MTEFEDTMQNVERNGSNVALLVREITHRICNEYSSAIGMLSLAAAKVANREAKIALQDAAERLHDHAIAHRALHIPAGEDPVDLADHICKVCRVIYRSSRLHERGISLTVSGDSISLTAEQCW